MVERTLVFIKPKAVARGLMGEVISRIERRGLKIVAMKLMKFTREQAEEFYEMHKGKDFYEPLIDYITSGPILAMVIEGKNVVSILRNMIGKTNPDEAKPGTIRGDLGLDTRRNVVHASDSLTNAEREIRILFKPNEIVEG